MYLKYQEMESDKKLEQSTQPPQSRLLPHNICLKGQRSANYCDY